MAASVVSLTRVARRKRPCLGCGRRQRQGLPTTGVAALYCAGCYDLIAAYMPAFTGQTTLAGCQPAYRPVLDPHTGKRVKPTFADLANAWYRSQGKEVPSGIEDPVRAG